MAAILLRVHLRAPPAAVWELLATDAGRERFWCERSVQHGEAIELHFPNGERLATRALVAEPGYRFGVAYFDGSLATFTLAPTADGGTDLTLAETDVPAATVAENRAGWVSVLLALKAAADFGVDLRNHDPSLTWDAGFVDN